MRNFIEVKNQTGFKKFLDVPSGNLYMILDETGFPEFMIRHFDGDIPSYLIPDLIEITGEVTTFIHHFEGLKDFIVLDELTEVGEDFIRRPFHVVHAFTNSYLEWETPPQVPPELDQLRRNFKTILDDNEDDINPIVRRVLVKTILDPSTKTYFKERIRKLVIIEPRIDKKDLEDWIIEKIKT